MIARVLIVIGFAVVLVGLTLRFRDLIKYLKRGS